MMKTRTIILLLLIAVPLLISSVALARPEQPVASNTTTQPSPTTGGAYQLDGSTWQISGISTGGLYQLLGPQGSTLRGNGCCCTYLPCLLRNTH